MKKKTAKKGSARVVLKESPAKKFFKPTIENVGVKIVADNPSYIPQYHTEGSACVDLVSNSDDIRIPHRGIFKFDCGFSMELPPGYKACIVSRSGLASKGIIVANAPGIIDSDYRGKICVILANIGHELALIKRGDRIAQMYIEPVSKFDWLETVSLGATTRGSGGFGSTG